MNKVCSYKDLRGILKVGMTVSAVKGKTNACPELHDDGSNTQTITSVDETTFSINGCTHTYNGCTHTYSGDVATLEIHNFTRTMATVTKGEFLRDVLNNRRVIHERFGDILFVSGTDLREVAIIDTFMHLESNGFKVEVDEEVKEMTVEEVSKLVGQTVKIIQ